MCTILQETANLYFCQHILKVSCKRKKRIRTENAIYKTKWWHAPLPASTIARMQQSVVLSKLKVNYQYYSTYLAHYTWFSANSSVLTKITSLMTHLWRMEAGSWHLLIYVIFVFARWRRENLRFDQWEVAFHKNDG